MIEAYEGKACRVGDRVRGVYLERYPYAGTVVQVEVLPGDEFHGETDALDLPAGKITNPDIFPFQEPHLEDHLVNPFPDLCGTRIVRKSELCREIKRFFQGKPRRNDILLRNVSNGGLVILVLCIERISIDAHETG